MRFYVGITDNTWFRFLAERRPDEVNFWRPGNTPFKVLQPGDLFLFKLHSPENYIAGGGYFVRYSQLPVSMTWEAFGEKNGHAGFDGFQKAILRLRSGTGIQANDPMIGSIILTAPFFWPREQWIPVPADFAKNIVTGKTYDITTATGLALWLAVQERLQLHAGAVLRDELPLVAEESRYGNEFLTRARLGQGAFRVLVTDAYERRCAMTGERTLPVLQAAHIKPFAEKGPNAVNNGLLLRSDIHTLFDKGYITVTPDLNVEVSKRLKEDWQNGRDYYALHGKPLARLPEDLSARPAREWLAWHNEKVWLG